MPTSATDHAPRLSSDRLVATARDLLVRGGAEAVVVREVARSLSVAPSAMYKHVPGREGLLTLLIAALYEEVTGACATAVAAEDPGAHRARIAAAIRTLRTWAGRHPAEFNLLFGYPLAGYSAPEDGPTAGSARRLGAVFVDVLRAAADDGRLRPGIAGPLASSGLLRQGDRDGLLAGLPPDLYYAVVTGWQRILGLVMVELSGQLDWAGPGAAALTTHQLDRLVDEVLTPGS